MHFNYAHGFEYTAIQATQHIFAYRTMQRSIDAHVER